MFTDYSPSLEFHPLAVAFFPTTSLETTTMTTSLRWSSLRRQTNSQHSSRWSRPRSGRPGTWSWRAATGRCTPHETCAGKPAASAASPLPPPCSGTRRSPATSTCPCRRRHHGDRRRKGERRRRRDRGQPWVVGHGQGLREEAEAGDGTGRRRRLQRGRRSR